MMLSLAFTFGFSEIFLLIFGIVIGIIWGAFIFVSRKRKLIISHLDKDFKTLSESEQNDINKMIDNIYSYHKRARKNKIKLFFGLITVKKKINYNELAYQKLKVKDATSFLSLGKEINWLIEEVAKVYYPESEYPLYELTIDEVFTLLKDLVNQLKEIINDLGIPNIEKIKVITFKDLVILSGRFTKIYNMKGVKIAINTLNAAIKVQTVLTPIYWIKKGTNVVSINSLSQFLTKCMFEVIGKETANIYSKNFIKN